MTRNNACPHARKSIDMKGTFLWALDISKYSSRKMEYLALTCACDCQLIRCLNDVSEFIYSLKWCHSIPIMLFKP